MSEFDRPHFDDAACTKRRDAPGDRDRFVEVPAVDQVVAAELLLRLRERTIGDDRLARLLAQRRRRLARAELRAGPVLTAGRQVLLELAVFAHDAIALRLGDLAPALFVEAAQQQVLHGRVSLKWRPRTPASR